MQQGLLEMPLFCLPKPVFFFQSGWDNAAPETKRKAGVKLGNTGCGGAGTATGEHVGARSSTGGAQRNPRRGKGPCMEFIYRVALPQSS